MAVNQIDKYQAWILHKTGIQYVWYPRERAKWPKHDGSVFCTVSISGHVVQHLAEASPPALGISARRQSVEFQKLIGSGINMVGSGYIFLGIIQQHKRQDCSKEQLPFIWRLAGVVQMSSKIGISPALSTLYLMFMIPSYSPILYFSLYFHLTQVWSLPDLVTHWMTYSCLVDLAP